jgi:aminoglycoside phosphotransferase
MSDAAKSDIILSRLPTAWKSYLADCSVAPVVTGMSGAFVFRLVTAERREQYLKLAKGTAKALLKQEFERTAWLDQQGIRVPRIVRIFEDSRLFALLSEGLAGTPADDHHGSAELIVQAIGLAFAELHALPVAECPFDESIEVRLRRAAKQIARGGVDPAQFDARNASLTPIQLLNRLQAQLPVTEDWVVAHGDATLSNVLVDAQGNIGLIDCGHAGRADRYVDLAILTMGIAEAFGQAFVDIFLRGYGGSEWDDAKAAFFRDLYELF